MDDGPDHAAVASVQPHGSGPFSSSGRPLKAGGLELYLFETNEPTRVRRTLDAVHVADLMEVQA